MTRTEIIAEMKEAKGPDWYKQARSDYAFGLSYKEIAAKHGKSRSAVILALGKAGSAQKRREANEKWREKITGRKPYVALMREFQSAVNELLNYLEKTDEEGLISHSELFCRIRGLSEHVGKRNSNLRPGRAKIAYGSRI